MNIQWYPGHMAKTKRMLKENLSLVDLIVEILDARIPYSSKNPDLDILAKGKPRIVLLNKADLAHEAATKQWTKYFEEQGFFVIPADSLTGRGLEEVVQGARYLLQEKIERQKKRGRIFVPIRAMIVGVPNVGKSTLINHYAGKAIARTGDRPGVTRAKQWVRLRKDFELLDTPGILWPKFEEVEVGRKLAVTGAVNDQILDLSETAVYLIRLLWQAAPTALRNRYALPPSEEQDPLKILQDIAALRGFKKKGGEIDLDRGAITLLDEFRGGKLGRVTLEYPVWEER